MTSKRAMATVRPSANKAPAAFQRTALFAAMSMLLLLIGSHHLPSAHSFPVSPARSILYSTKTPSLLNTATTSITKPRININIHRTNKSFTQLYAGEDSNENVNDVSASSSLGESESTLLGI
eukprot:114217_1